MSIQHFPKPRPGSPPNVTRIVAMLLALLMVGSMVNLATPAHAADGAVSDVAVSVAQDGSQPLVPKYDDDLHNGRVATNDEIRWTVRGNVTTAGEVTYRSNLPKGMVWDSVSIADTICDVDGTISSDKRTWSCTRNADSGVESFEIRAHVGSVANGESIAATVESGDQTGTAPGVTVVGETKTEMRVYSDSFNEAATYEGKQGTSFAFYSYPGITAPSVAGAPNGNVRGAQALNDPFTFTLAVPPGAVVTTAKMRSDYAGNVSVEQDQPGDDVRVTVSGANTDFLNTSTGGAVPSGYRMNRGGTQIGIFVPNDPALPDGEITKITTQVKDFDPEGLDGTSNFGADFALGQEPDYTCPNQVSIGRQLACAVYNVDRTGDLLIERNASGATLDTNGLLLGDNHGYIGGTEKIVPGSNFRANMGFRNLSRSSRAAASPFACTTFDNSKIVLNGDVGLRLVEAASESSTYLGSRGSSVPTDDYLVEYSAQEFSNDDERRDVDCGVAGDGAEGWVDDPADLENGKASVTSIRVKADIDLEPGVALGVATPMKRTTNSQSLQLPVNAPIPWFFQYGTEDSDLVKSTYPSDGSAYNRGDGGFVRAVPSLIRANTSFSDRAIDPGTSSTLSVKPFLVGAIGDGFTTRSEDMSATVTMDTTCMDFTEGSLESLVDAGSIASYDLTPADPGPDGLTCTDDDGGPASVKLVLGSRDVPSGASDLKAAGYSGLPGHQVDLPVLNIGVTASPMAQSDSYSATTVMAASTDTSLEYAPDNTGTDRTDTSGIDITGVAALTGGKSASTAEPGFVGPNEPFQYTLTWANGTGDESGPGTFVDVLPFNGDERGTTGLGELNITSVSAAMQNPDLMGDVQIQYTTDDSADVAAAVAREGNEDGAEGINWQNKGSSRVPATGVTALRFVMEDNLKPGYVGSATIGLRAPDLSIGGKLVNDLYGRTAPLNNDPTTGKAFRAVSSVELESTAAELGGTVFRDLDFSGSINDADDSWPGNPDVEIIDDATGAVVATVPLSDEGTYRTLVPEGTYLVRLKDGTHDGWKQIEKDSRSVDRGETSLDFDQLYAEVVDDPVLKDDSAETQIGSPIDIDVTANDTLHFPKVSQGKFPRDGVKLGETDPKYGSVELVDPAGDSDQSQIRYTPPEEWPEEFADQDTFEDTFTYSWTNAVGVTETATVTVTVTRADDGGENVNAAASAAANADADPAAQAAADADANDVASAEADADSAVAAEAAAEEDASSQASEDADTDPGAAAQAAADPAAEANNEDDTQAEASAAADVDASSAAEAAAVEDASSQASAETEADVDADSNPGADSGQNVNAAASAAANADADPAAQAAADADANDVASAESDADSSVAAEAAAEEDASSQASEDADTDPGAAAQAAADPAAEANNEDDTQAEASAAADVDASAAAEAAAVADASSQASAETEADVDADSNAGADSGETATADQDSASQASSEASASADSATGGSETGGSSTADGGGSDTDADGGGGNLPITGLQSTLEMVALALLLIGVGAAAVTVVRKRRLRV